MLRQVNKKNQVTLPPQFLEALGVREEDYLSIALEGRRMVLKPVRIEEEPFSKQDLDALENLIDEQLGRGAYTSFTSDQRALAHLKKLTKK